ncbi:MAG: DUF2147 domain-containing protein [Treponema sp.]|jgi:uncharacterized protein (DUF2147 family)|nr:DUF2147 domain-containing protein [Treponema sp.]
MKRAIFSFCLIISAVGFCFAVDPVEGYWFSIDDKTSKVVSAWEMYVGSNGVLHGRLLSAVGVTASTLATRCKETYANFPVSGKVNLMPVLSTTWFFGFRMERAGRWVGGSIINPEDGSMYKAELTHHPIDGKRYKAETLEVRGFLLFFSGAQYWQRCTREEAMSLR